MFICAAIFQRIPFLPLAVQLWQLCYRGASFDVPCWCQCLALLVSHRVRTVSILRSSLNL